MPDNFPGLDNLVDDMWETMNHAHGCGLAAPQIGRSLKLFIVDSQSTFDSLSEAGRKDYFETGDTGIQETFINATITRRSRETWEDDEGCLSIPQLLQPVTRPWSITIVYQDIGGHIHTRAFAGATARMIQHEYDHTLGILYTDHLTPFTRKRLGSRLQKISRGRCPISYPMQFPQ